MKKVIGILVLTVFLGGMILGAAGCSMPPYSNKPRNSDDHGGGSSGHSH